MYEHIARIDWCRMRRNGSKRVEVQTEGKEVKRVGRELVASRCGVETFLPDQDSLTDSEVRS